MLTKSISKMIVEDMYNNDPFTKWLGIKIIKIKEGYCELEMEVRAEMLNAFKIAHGGITYSMADTALAFASNTREKKCLSIETSISHTKSCAKGDVIIAKAIEKSLTNKIAIYEITITNQAKEIVALFKGTVYRTSKDWIK